MSNYADKVSENIRVFRDTMDQCKGDPFLKESISWSQRKTKLYGPGPLQVQSGHVAFHSGPAEVLVSDKRSFQAAMGYPGKRVVVLNFASATNPGGGVKSGSNAQEESLCRCSTLFPCLNTQRLAQDYYMFHRNREDAFFTSSAIFTPGIVIFKTDDKAHTRIPDEQATKVDVITCAAPNLGRMPLQPPMDLVYSIHVERARKILSIAALNGAEVVILGAFGCGAFKNSPSDVARAYATVLPEFIHNFETIEFAVNKSEINNQNHEVFSKMFYRFSERFVGESL